MRRCFFASRVDNYHIYRYSSYLAGLQVITHCEIRLDTDPSNA